MRAEGRPQELRPARGAEGRLARRHASGETVCIIGPSGSGKTTFIRCINHLEKIDAGRITVNGHLIGYRQKGGKLVEDSEKSVARQRTQIGMVFQRFNLFPHKTALENVTEAPVHVLGAGQGQGVRGRRAAAHARRPRRQVRHVPGQALRRPAAAGGDRPRARDEAGPHALRRADERPRPGGDRARCSRSWRSSPTRA